MRNTVWSEPLPMRTSTISASEAGAGSFASFFSRVTVFFHASRNDVPLAGSFTESLNSSISGMSEATALPWKSRPEVEESTLR